MIMTSQKVPYWLSPKDLKSLREVMSQDKIIGELAEGIRDEIGVAKVRAKTSRISTNSLIKVLGLSKGSVPLQLSEEEVTFLAALEALPEKVKNKLS